MKSKRSDAPVEAIFSFKPRWANAILDGEKRIELRHRAPIRPISKAWIYSSFPVQKIVGWFVPGRIFEPMDAEALYTKFGYEAIMGRPYVGSFDEDSIIQTRLGPKSCGEIGIGQTIGVTKKYRPIEVLCPTALDHSLSPSSVGLGDGPTGRSGRWTPPVSWRYCAWEDRWLIFEEGVGR